MKIIPIVASAIISLNALASTNIHERTLVVSNVLYVIKYEVKDYEHYIVPLTNPLGQPHYECVASIYNGTNKIASIETQWTEKGCFEDSPMMLIGRALHWKRYPNNSAGQGHHWVVEGLGMRSEND